MTKEKYVCGDCKRFEMVYEKELGGCPIKGGVKADLPACDRFLLKEEENG